MLWHYKQKSLLFRRWAEGKNVLFEPALFNSWAACAQHAPSLWAGPGTVFYWRGHFRCKATGSGSWRLHPWHKLLHSGAKGLTPGSWWAPDRQGPSKQLVTITNSGKRTMNAIIYKITVQVFFRFSLLCLFTLTLFHGAAWWGCDLGRTAVSRIFSLSSGKPCYSCFPHHQACWIPCCLLFHTDILMKV